MILQHQYLLDQFTRQDKPSFRITLDTTDKLLGFSTWFHYSEWLLSTKEQIITVTAKQQSLEKRNSIVRISQVIIELE